MLAWIQNALRETQEGMVWGIVGSYTSLLKAVDLIGLKRAMGAAFFTAGGFNSSGLSEYLSKISVNKMRSQGALGSESWSGRSDY